MILEIDYTEHKNIAENKIKLRSKQLFTELINLLSNFFKESISPSVSKIKEEGASVFEILISTMISARTKDEVTYPASKRLFDKAKTAREISLLSEEEISKLIYPSGFYKTKAKHIKKTCEILVEKYNGLVPDKMDQLLNLPGVGRKTANLVLAVGFQKDGLCVDTHVHRISNRLGIIKTKDPFETEMQLRKILPKNYWEIYNRLLVLLGQKICSARKPDCNNCPINKLCKKVGVKA